MAWSRAGGAEAALVDCFASALRPPTQRAAEPSPRPSFVINVRGGAANRSLAVLATAAAVRGAGSWRALLEAGAQAKEGGQAARGGAAPAATTAVRPSVASLPSLTCSGAPTLDAAAVATAATTAAATAAEAEAKAAEAAAWPAVAAKHGFCGVTNDGVEGSCSRGDAGSWNTRQHRVTSFGDCVARCVGCARCRYVTYAADEDDCSWCVLQPATQSGAGCNPRWFRLQP